MSERYVIAIDAMGGDRAPNMVIGGLRRVCTEFPNVDFLVFGDESRLTELVDKHPSLKTRCTVQHAPDAVNNEDKVAYALRNRRQSSMALAINAVKEGEAAAIVSAGSTGALMAMAKLAFRTLPGIKRPAIPSVFPTRKQGKTLMLDLGANVECDAEDLVQFAVMGEVYARQVLGVDKPSIGILNVGSEDMKGHNEVREAAQILQNSVLPIHFYGFVEGNDIANGTVDVVVTDGFTGNIALKAIEGTANFLVVSLRRAMTTSLLTKIGALLARPALKKFWRELDPRRYNGAMFLGLNGICVKSHGGTDAVGFANAVRVAMQLIESGVNERIREDLDRIMVQRTDPQQTADA
ncbi:MAG: phosphate acyltransferase PlsX [Magnetospiraceae bacterium]